MIHVRTRVPSVQVLRVVFARFIRYRDLLPNYDDTNMDDLPRHTWHIPGCRLQAPKLGLEGLYETLVLPAKFREFGRLDPP